VDRWTLAEQTLEAVFNASVTLHQAGNLEQAAQGYRRVLAAVAHQPVVLGYLGMALAQAQHHEGAIPLLRRAARLAPDDAAIRSNLATSLTATGRKADARAEFRRATALAPSFCSPHFSGAFLAPNEERKVVELGRAAASDPGFVPALLALAIANDGLGRSAAAARWSRRASASTPQDGPVLLACIDHALAERDIERARLLARRALACGGEPAGAWFRLGGIAEKTGDIDGADRCYRHSLVLEPAFPASHVAQGSLELGIGRPRQAVNAYDRASASGGGPEAEGNRVFAMTFLDHADPQYVNRANRTWAAANGARASSGALRSRRSPRIRVGYVSPEFAKHGFLAHLFPALDNHDRTRIELFAYSQTPVFDAWSAEVRRRVDHWRDLTRLSLDDQAASIQGDGIDVLVNLTGYLAHHRLLFAHRIAPVQVAYINHVCTTGLPTIDARMTDPWLEPEAAPFLDPDERLVRLATGYLSYAPPPAPPVSALPALANGFLTFGVFNNIAKISGRAVEAWSEILSRIPRSRILIKGYGLSATRGRALLIDHFRQNGIDESRVELVGHVPGDQDNLATVARADIALDPFPFNGGMSTGECLWMGVPVVSLAGPSLVHRVGLTFLSRTGHSDLVAWTTKDYVDRAVALETDISALAERRGRMRERLSRSVLFDGASHTRELEAAFETLLNERRA